MKTLRRLAFLALFAAAAPAFAGPPAENVPAPTTTKLVTADQLRDVVPGWFKGATVEGKGDASTFLLPAMPHTTENGKETMNWSVYFRLHTRAERPTAVRIFFPCKAVPADAHPERLADLMNMSGGIQDSPAYFIVAGTGKDRMLTLVTEMPLATLGRDTLEAEIKGLFRAAEKTMSLWTADLSKSPAKAEGKREVRQQEAVDVTGLWAVAEKGKPLTPVAKVAGVQQVQFEKGVVRAVIALKDDADIKDWVAVMGTYTVEDGTLVLTLNGGKKEERYDIYLKDGVLSVTPGKGAEGTFASRSTTLHRTK